MTRQPLSLSASLPFPGALAPEAAAAVRCAEGRFSYGALRERVARQRARLRDAGVGPGDRVALWGPNGLDWVVSALALWSLGAAAALVSPRWLDAELAAALTPLAVRGVLAPSELAERAAKRGWTAWAWEPDGLETPAPPGATEQVGALASSAPAVYVFTSGTTGVPKAVELRWEALYASAEAVSDVLALGAADTWWHAMPLCHVGGLGATLRCFWRGAEVWLAPRFEPADAAAALESGEVAIASFVPTMLRSVLEALGPRPWPARVRAAMLGGAAIPEDLVARCPAALASYGLSEAASTVTLVPPGASAAVRATSGLPLPGVALVIRDETGAPLPAGRVGEITVETPACMAGYFGQGEASARAVRGGVLHTGDYGSLDAAGALTVLSRRQDLIVSGGENLYPAEIEAALRSHPRVREAVVVPVEDAHWGQRPYAFVQLLAGEAFEEASLAAWLDERLARFKHPVAYARLDEWPLLANGKVDRRALRAQAAPTAR